jgi:hypothetical protein
MIQRPGPQNVTKGASMQRILGFSIGFLFVLVTRTEAGRHEPRSLLDYFLDAEIVAICTLENAIPPSKVLPKGQVDLVLEDVLRTHMIIKGRKSIVHPVHVEPTKGKHIVAVHVDKGMTYAYIALPLDREGEIERFVRHSVLLNDKSRMGRAKYALDFLLSPNKMVADSADIEFSRISYADLRKVAETVKPETCVKAIQGNKDSSGPSRWHAMLLGHCGKKEHAVILQQTIDGSKNPKTFVRSEVFIALTLLDREAGWRAITDIVVNKELPFLTRYNALHAARFFFTERKDVIDEKTCVAAVSSVLTVADMADFAVEDLRKWRRWEYSDTILKLPAKSAILRKCVLRFALQCPTQQAKDFVNTERTRDREFVEETEELLALENEQDTPPKK